MRDAIPELGYIEVELGAASKAPEEVRIDCGEMVEEPFAAGELVVRDLVVLKELLLREPPDGSLGAGEVADAWGRVDARKEGVNARGAPGRAGSAPTTPHPAQGHADGYSSRPAGCPG